MGSHQLVVEDHQDKGGAAESSGEIAAAFLTGDAEQRERIQAQPMLEWKTQNVRRHRGLDR